MLKIMKKLSLSILMFAATATSQALSAPLAPTSAAPQPKLVVVLVVDGLPNEQVQRYRDQFGKNGKGGLGRMLADGAAFSNAHQAHGVTVTAIGHSAVLSGAYPYVHGIIGNNWIDPVTKKSVYCTEDTRYTYIGEKTDASDGTAPTKLEANPTNFLRVLFSAIRNAILLRASCRTVRMRINGSTN